MLLECKSCEHEWDYQGDSDYYATCPNCYYKVKIPAEAEVVAPKKELTYDIAVLGGTGNMGAGIVKRSALAGYKIAVGSRKQDKAKRLAREYKEDLKETEIENFEIDGLENPKAAQKSEMVIVTIPYQYALSTVKSLDLNDKIVVSTLVPMEKKDGYFEYAPPEEGSAAEALQSRCKGTVISAFQNVPAAMFNNLEKDLSYDVVVCGNDNDPKERVMNLVEDISGLRALDGGPLSNSSTVESETPKLLNLAKKNSMKNVSVVYTDGTSVGVGEFPEEFEDLESEIQTEREGMNSVITLCPAGAAETEVKEVAETFKKEIKNRNWEEEIDFKRAECPGISKEGPIIIIEPERTCFLQVSAEDAEDIVTATFEDVVIRRYFGDTKSSRLSRLREQR